MFANISLVQILIVYLYICGFGLNIWWIYRGIRRMFR
jgi:hypothetical protein